MAELKQSEARLLGIFGILILGAITFFVLGQVKKKQAAVMAQQTAIKNKTREYNELISEKEQWEVRREFVQRFQPVFRTEEQEAPALEAYFKRAAEAEGVEVTKFFPQPPVPIGDDMMAMQLKALITGTGAQVLGFVSQLQTEDRFYSISSMFLDVDRKDPTIVSVNMIFERLFILDGELPLLDEVEPTEAEPTPAATAPDIARKVAKPPVSMSSSAPPALLENPAKSVGEGDAAAKTPVAVKENEESADTKAN